MDSHPEKNQPTNKRLKISPEKGAKQSDKMDEDGQAVHPSLFQRLQGTVDPAADPGARGSGALTNIELSPEEQSEALSASEAALALEDEDNPNAFRL